MVVLNVGHPSCAADERWRGFQHHRHRRAQLVALNWPKSPPTSREYKQVIAQLRSTCRGAGRSTMFGDSPSPAHAGHVHRVRNREHRSRPSLGAEISTAYYLPRRTMNKRNVRGASNVQAHDRHQRSPCSPPSCWSIPPGTTRTSYLGDGHRRGVGLRGASSEWLRRCRLVALIPQPASEARGNARRLCQLHRPAGVGQPHAGRNTITYYLGVLIGAVTFSQRWSRWRDCRPKDRRPSRSPRCRLPPCTDLAGTVAVVYFGARYSPRTARVRKQIPRLVMVIVRCCFGDPHGDGPWRRRRCQVVGYRC